MQHWCSQSRKASKCCFLSPKGGCCIWMHFGGHFESISSVSHSAFFFDCQVYFWTEVEELCSLMKTEKQGRGETCTEFNTDICFARYLSSWPQTRADDSELFEGLKEVHPRDDYIETILQIKEKEGEWSVRDGFRKSRKVQNKWSRFSLLASKRPIVPRESFPLAFPDAG